MAALHSDPPHRREWSRRAFLGAVSNSLVAAACRRTPYDARLFARPDRSSVGLYAARDYSVDFKDLIGRGLCRPRSRRAWAPSVPQANMVEYESNTAINTNPLVVAGAALAFPRSGRRLGDDRRRAGPSPRHGIPGDADRPVRALRENRIAFIDLNQDDVAEVPLRSRFTGLDRLGCRSNCCSRTSSCRCPS